MPDILFVATIEMVVGKIARKFRSARIEVAVPPAMYRRSTVLVFFDATPAPSELSYVSGGRAGPQINDHAAATSMGRRLRPIFKARARC